MSWKSAIPALALTCVLGCGQESATVSGTVTFEGQAVEHGFITFFPAEGAANTCGAEIADGKYCVQNFTTGKKKVLVTVPPQVEMRSARNGKKLTLVRSQTIPLNAVGNNQITEITASTRTLDIELRKPQR